MSKAWVVALIAGVVAALLLVEKLAGSPDDWEARLDSAVSAIEVRQEARFARYVADSARMASELASADSATQVATEQLRLAHVARTSALVTAERARKALALAQNPQDTIKALMGEVVSLRAVVMADSQALQAAKGESAGLRVQLGVSQQQVATERDLRLQIQADLDKLLGVASSRPRGLTLFGFKLSLKPMIGYGLNINPATGKVDHGIVLGVSVLRG